MSTQIPIETTTNNNSVKKKTSVRWLFGGFFFLLGVISYMDRANLAIVAEPMMRELNMSKVEFGLLGSFFSLGYALAQIPSGIIAERFGSRITVAISLAVWSFFTIMTALTSKYFWLCTVRFLFGVGEAPIFPSNAVFNTYWFRKNEKARAASLLVSGTYFGPVVAPLLTVAIMMYWSWHMVFYIFGGIGLVVAVIWYLMARSRPDDHTWVSKEELEHIKAGRVVNEAQDKVKAPWRKFLKRYDFWAVGIQYFFVAYMTSLFLIWLPTFLQEARGFSMTKMGIAASFPWLTICACVLVGGVVSDKLLQSGKSSLVARGYVAIAGLVVFIIGICATAYTTSTVMTVFWLSITLGSLGLPVVASWAMAADKGREYAGSVSGWMNFCGNLGAVLSPVICGALAQYFGWNTALLFNVIPITLAIFCWIFIKPDSPLTTPLVT